MRSYSSKMFRFIEEHLMDSPSMLRLRFHGKTADDFSYEEAIDQIEARRKSNGKLEALTSHPLFIFPAVICAEQASASAVAEFHASLIPDEASLLDITCGLGSDTFAFARKAANVTAVEREPHYFETLLHNISVLGLTNITPVNADSAWWINVNRQYFDVIFADPHRRGEGNRRQYKFTDCAPDMTQLTPLLLERCRMLLVKASPMLDIMEAAREIVGTEEVYVVSYNGECKEVLIKARKGATISRATAVNLSNSSISVFSTNIEDVSKCGILLKADQSLESGWIYEPNPSLMKLKPWDSLCRRFEGLRQLHPNTNLFFCEQLIKDFPGRIFRITGTLFSGDMKRLKGMPFNVISRNYPEKAEELHCRLRLKSGDKEFLIATTRQNGPSRDSRIILRCTKES